MEQEHRPSEKQGQQKSAIPWYRILGVLSGLLIIISTQLIWLGSTPLLPGLPAAALPWMIWGLMILGVLGVLYSFKLYNQSRPLSGDGLGINRHDGQNASSMAPPGVDRNIRVVFSV